MDNDIFKFLINCDLGLSSFMKKEATFYHKKKLSNERQQYHYEPLINARSQQGHEITMRAPSAFEIRKLFLVFIIYLKYNGLT